MLLSLLACTPNLCDITPGGEASVVAIGDSILAWHGPRCQSVVHHTALSLEQPVDNAAVNGARLVEDEPIAEQLPEGDYDTVLIDGGANDLNGRLDVCEDGDLDAALDELSAEMARIVDGQVQLDREVWLLGYYRMPEDARYGFGACGDELEALNQRYLGLAEAREGVEFLDLGEVIAPTDLEALDADKVHPSPLGAERLGAFLAEALSGDEG
jgi:acyl-CoA thioesterase-1